MLPMICEIDRWFHEKAPSRRWNNKEGCALRSQLLLDANLERNSEKLVRT